MNEIKATSQPGTGSGSVSRRNALRQLCAGALSAVVLAGTRRRPALAQATPTADAVEAVARQAIEAVNAALATGETGAIDDVFAADVAGHPPHRSLMTGEPFSHDLDGLKSGLADIHRFVPDAAIAIDELIARDTTVAARVTFRGTLDAAALGVSEGAGGPLEIGGLMYGRVEDGRIAEFWAYFDPAVLLDLYGPASKPAPATPEGEAGHGQEETAPAGEVEAGAEEVAVTVTEFSIALAPSTLRVGQPYAFVVTNEGAVAHEFVIERPGATHDPLVAGEREAMVEGIAPGETRTLGWTFAEPGSYQLACHEPGHYEAGQVVVIEVAR